MKKLIITFFLIFIFFSLFPQSREIWDLHFQVDVTTATGFANISGTETDGEYFYVSNSMNNQIAKLDLAGNLVDTFSIPNIPFGLEDMTTDGSYFYSGSGSASTIFQMDFSTHTIVDDITTPMAVDGIAYDPDEDGFWITNWQSQMLILIDRNGTVLNQMVFTDGANGLTHQTDATGNDYLWIYSGIYTGGDGIVTQYQLPGLIPTGLTHNVTSDFPGTHSGGLFFSNEIILGIEILGGIAKGTACCLFGYEIGSLGAAPGPPTNFTLTADPGGALEVLINWTNPAVDVNGNPLTELDEIRLYREGELIYTEPWPVIGEECTYTDYGAPSGMVDYMIATYNNYGGSSVSGEVWIGPDVPAAVTNFYGEQMGNIMFIILSWINPTTSLHGGYLYYPILGFYLEDSTGNINYNIPALVTMFPVPVPGPGVYSFNITPYNIIGDGGSATSNEIIVEITSVEPNLVSVSELSNFPNPFNPTTEISFQLSGISVQQTPEILIYNMKGQKIRQFSIFNFQSSIIWNGTDQTNKSVSSGIYFYQLKVDGKVQKSKKMMLIK